MGQRGPSVAYANWRVELFQYMEQDNLYKHLNVNDVYNSAALKNQVLPIWKCPSSPAPDTQPAAWVTWWTNNNHQVPGYIGIMGAYPDPIGRTGVTLNSNYGGWWSSNGMLVANEQTRIADCTDGTSNTIIVAEQSGLVGTADLRNGYYTPWGSCTFPGKISAPGSGDIWGMGLTCVAYARGRRVQGVRQPAGGGAGGTGDEGRRAAEVRPAGEVPGSELQRGDRHGQVREQRHRDRVQGLTGPARGRGYFSRVARA